MNQNHQDTQYKVIIFDTIAEFLLHIYSYKKTFLYNTVS